VKRAVAALVMLGIATATAAPSMAATTVYGSAQLKYTVNATASVSIAVNYDPTTGSIKNATAGSILPSAAGNCTAAVAEGVNATLTFGGITPPGGAAYTGCYYQNAVSVGVLSNDTNGVKVLEYLDSVPTGTAVCVFPLGTVNTLSALPAASGASGNPAAYTGAACPTVNSIAGQALTAPNGSTITGGPNFGAAGAPAGVTTNVNATTSYVAWTAGGVQLFNGAAAAGLSGTTYKYVGQDVQMNVNGTAASGANTSIITVAVIPL
jgi:hypothetical protein